MKLLFYATGESDYSRVFQDRIESLVPTPRREVYSNLASLHQRLCRPRDGLTIAILVAANRDELWKFLAMQKLLSDLRLLLILPDRSRETVTSGHRLAPRFLSYVDNGLDEVEAVLAHMLQQDLNQVRTVSPQLAADDIAAARVP